MVTFRDLPMHKRRRQFSFFSLLFIVTLAALIIASVLAYQRSFTAQLRWASITTSKAVQLFPQSKVIQDSSGNYECEYFATRRDIQQLLSLLNGSSYRVGDESVKVTGLTKHEAEATLAKLKVHDALQPGHFVIRGKVIDATGQPLPQATIDLYGDFMFVNCFTTRDDGTFIAAFNDIDPNFRGTGAYALKIRMCDESRQWQSKTFRLKATDPEQVVVITVN